MIQDAKDPGSTMRRKLSEPVTQGYGHHLGRLHNRTPSKTRLEVETVMGKGNACILVKRLI